MLISQEELEKALEAFSNTNSLMIGDFVYKATDTSGQEFYLTRERVAALALLKFKELRKALGMTMLHEVKK